MYVLLPPSTTEHGEYQWASQGKTLFATEAMLKVNKKAKERSEDHDTWIIPPDMPENIEACTEWLRHTAKIATEGEGGDGMAYPGPSGRPVARVERAQHPSAGE